MLNGIETLEDYCYAKIQNNLASISSTSTSYTD